MLKLQVTRKAQIRAINTYQSRQESLDTVQLFYKLIVHGILLACECKHIAFSPVGVLVDHLVGNWLAGVRFNGNISNAETNLRSVVGDHSPILRKHEDGESLAPIALLGCDI